MARTTDPEKKSADEEYAERLRALERLQKTLKAEFPGRSLADELIAERRAIARAENADYSQRQDDDD
jgi:two-component sensor histidine kinase